MRVVAGIMLVLLIALVWAIHRLRTNIKHRPER
jgi:hypothetical protein